MAIAPDGPVFVVTGPFGLVGRALLEKFPPVVPLGRNPPPSGFPDGGGFLFSPPPVDVADAEGLRRALERIAGRAEGRPLVVIHLAALTDTAGADEAAFERVNVRGVENVRRAARGVGAKLLHLSTDYVFCGETGRSEPFREEDRPSAPPPAPYALSKFRAEKALLEDPGTDVAVVRIAFPYGGGGHGPGLDVKLLRRFAEARRTGKPLPLFRDQTISPSYLPDVASGILSLAGRAARGALGGARVFHLTGEPTTPWEFGSELRRLAGFEDVPLEPASAEGTTYALNLALSTEKTREALGWRPTPHREALRERKERGPWPFPATS